MRRYCLCLIHMSHCILNYGCEVWGSHKGGDIEKIHLHFLKRTLNVRRSTVNFMIYFESGRVPMYVTRYCKMIKYWCKILKTENIVLKTCYETMFESSQRKFNHKSNWAGNIRDILCKYGLNDIWISQNVCNVDKCLHEFKQRVIDCFVREAVSFFEDSPRCHYYRYIHDNHKLQFYLSRPINYMFKPLICKYRKHAHSLQIETGRYFNIYRHKIICDLCIEDEYHFILKCKKYIDISTKYIKPYYWRKKASAFKLVKLLSVCYIKELNNLG